ncbi:MAG: alpha/beta fold hydrolase [Solirubrobacterales bacterium]|nr:alpha/beta fold hydrolase [Solirubrobacterales bacterium]
MLRGPADGATFVLVHGSNHGGWCWGRVKPLLEAARHSVYTPTLTGLAERADELTPEVGLSTHVSDITELIEGEDLHGVTLVGHSYAGAVITGAAEIVGDRIARLVYLDAFLPRDRESVLDTEPPESREAFLQIAREQGDGWRLPRDRHRPRRDGQRARAARRAARRDQLKRTLRSQAWLAVESSRARG